MTTVTGVILAGGKASRFGAPKGLAEVGGARILDRVAAALGAVADELLLIANVPEAAAWLPGVRVVGDVLPGRGALGGVHAALHHARGPALVVAWDMPFVPAALLAELRALGDAGAAAATPESHAPRGVEPLCAYYGAGCLAAAGRRLADVPEGGRTVCPSTLLADVGAARVPLARVTAVYGDPDALFMNVNTPDDLARARALAGAR